MPHPVRADVIVLNGTSSAGKSSIAKEIQQLLGEPCIHFQLDAFFGLFAWDTIRDREQHRAAHAFSVSAFHQTLSLVATSGYLIVVDHVFEQPNWYDDCMRALQNAKVFLVGVKCSLGVLEARERKRPDRYPGQARSQLEIVHREKSYDLIIDTSDATPKACAKQILEKIRTDWVTWTSNPG